MFNNTQKNSNFLAKDLSASFLCLKLKSPISLKICIGLQLLINLCIIGSDLVRRLLVSRKNFVLIINLVLSSCL